MARWRNHGACKDCHCTTVRSLASICHARPRADSGGGGRRQERDGGTAGTAGSPCVQEHGRRAPCPGLPAGLVTGPARLRGHSGEGTAGAPAGGNERDRPGCGARLKGRARHHTRSPGPALLIRSARAHGAAVSSASAEATGPGSSSSVPAFRLSPDKSRRTAPPLLNTTASPRPREEPAKRRAGRAGSAVAGRGAQSMPGAVVLPSRPGGGGRGAARQRDYSSRGRAGGGGAGAERGQLRC